MCACEGSYVCSRCAGTRDEPGYADWLDVADPTDALSEPVGAVLTPREVLAHVR